MTPKRPDPIKFLTGRLSDRPVPNSVLPIGPGAKFAPDGRVLPWPGNTFICHIDPDSPQHRALCQMQTALMASNFAGYFTYLPASSFHMTVFQGISNGTDWPAGIPPEATLDEATDQLIQRLDGITLPRSVTVRAQGLYGGFGLTLSGASPADEAKLRDTRTRLRDATGIQPDDFDSYIFHITLSYLLRWLDEAQAAEVVALSEALFTEFGAPLGQIKLGAPEFCRFENMHHFAPILHL